MPRVQPQLALVGKEQRGVAAGSRRAPAAWSWVVTTLFTPEDPEADGQPPAAVHDGGGNAQWSLRAGDSSVAVRLHAVRR